jgi:hypothetical protein
VITGEKGQKDLMNDRQPCYNVKIQTEKDMNTLFNTNMGIIPYNS